MDTEREELTAYLKEVTARDLFNPEELGERVSSLLSEEGVVRPTPGRIVWYQTDGRNGLDYYLPAMVTVTRNSHPGDYPDGTPNSLAVPSSELHVHLTVFTPGGFGSVYVNQEDVESEYSSGVDKDELENLGKPKSFVPGSGTYVELDVPYNPAGDRRSWRWPERD
jgi:hypothetical protein